MLVEGEKNSVSTICAEDVLNIIKGAKVDTAVDKEGQVKTGSLEVRKAIQSCYMSCEKYQNFIETDLRGPGLNSTSISLFSNWILARANLEGVLRKNLKTYNGDFIGTLFALVKNGDGGSFLRKADAAIKLVRNVERMIAKNLKACSSEGKNVVFFGDVNLSILVKSIEIDVPFFHRTFITVNPLEIQFTCQSVVGEAFSRGGGIIIAPLYAPIEETGPVESK